MIKFYSFLIYGFILISISSCASIVGGTNYNAKVLVKDHPNAQIEYNGLFRGTGEATFKAKRRDANKFSVTIMEKGCKTETKHYTKRSFRGWAFVGTLVGWTGIYMGVPLPWGVAVDGISGAWWRPDVQDKGVVKLDYDNYAYYIDYRGCDNNSDNIHDQEERSASKMELLRSLKKLYDDGVLTKDEFEKEKKKILEENNNQ